MRCTKLSLFSYPRTRSRATLPPLCSPSAAALPSFCALCTSVFVLALGGCPPVGRSGKVPYPAGKVSFFVRGLPRGKSFSVLSRAYSVGKVRALFSHLPRQGGAPPQEYTTSGGCRSGAAGALGKGPPRTRLLPVLSCFLSTQKKNRSNHPAKYPLDLKYPGDQS